MQVAYPYRGLAVVMGLIAALQVVTGLTEGQPWLASGGLCLAASVVRVYWVTEEEARESRANRGRTVVLLLRCSLVVLIAHLAGFVDFRAQAETLEPVAVPIGLACLLGMIAFSVIPQLRRERWGQR